MPRRPGGPGRAGRPAGHRRPQDQALIAVAEAFTAAARGKPAAALRHARAVLDQVGALSISGETLRWAWPLAARAAHDVADTAATGELLALLDGYRPGQLAPMQRAERDLARVRLTPADAGPDTAGAAWMAAIGEAAGVAQRLRCQPLLDRADTIQPTRPRTAAS